jgi:SOS response regulatory protein OraA/RecX
MADNDIKIIKYTLTLLLARREQSMHELLKTPLKRDFERQLSVECIYKLNQHHQQIIVRFAESFIQGRDNKGIS